MKDSSSMDQNKLVKSYQTAYQQLPSMLNTDDAKLKKMRTQKRQGLATRKKKSSKQEIEVLKMIN